MARVFITGSSDGLGLMAETLERVGGAHHLVLLRAPYGRVARAKPTGWDDEHRVSYVSS